MFIVLIIFFLVLSIGMLLWNYFSDYDYNPSDSPAWWIRGVIGIFSVIAAIGLFIALMVLIPKIATEQKYETQIETIQESNSVVEQQICSAVETYLRHEENVYEKIDVTVAIGLFSAYPNLKSNELVQSLIDTYQSNAAEIKSLKLERINLSTAKFLVYFGH